MSSMSAIYSANSRYNKKIESGKAPTEKELEAHQIMSARSPRTPEGSKIRASTPSAPRKSRSPRTPLASGITVSTPPAPRKTRSRSPRSPRNSPNLSPEQHEYRKALGLNALYHKMIKNGQTPTEREIIAHEIVEANKKPKVTSPRSLLSPEQKYQERLLNITNARYVKKLKNGKEPTMEERKAHEMVEAKKLEASSPRVLSSSRRLESTFDEVYKERVILAGNARYAKAIENGRQPSVEEIRDHQIVEAGILGSSRSGRSSGAGRSARSPARVSSPKARSAGFF